MAVGGYRYVIVGAGAAGCVLADRLSADSACRVALVEAGGPDRKREIRIPVAASRLFQTAYDWNYRTSKQPQMADRELYWPRGKTLGGSSSINGQAWVRGHRADYDAWAQSCPGWSYDEVLAYFQRAERRVGSNAGGVYGTAGPLCISELRDPNPTTSAFLAACAELGLRRLGELNEPDNTGYAPTPVTQRRGLRHSAADAYLRPARRRGNLTVLTGAHARRILLDGTRATGVEYRDAAGVTQQVTASHEVILSAGAVNSPQLLMLSGIGDADQLRAAGVQPRHELVGVGANLQDHLACAVIVHCPKPITLLTAESPAQLARFLLARRGMLTSNVAEAVAFVRSDPALTAPDFELIWLPVPFLDHGLTPPPGHGLSLGVVLLQPDSRGHIRLASANPPPSRRSSTPATSPPSRTCAVLLPACASPSGCATPRRCVPMSATLCRPGQASSMTRAWRGWSGNTPRRRTTLWAPAVWAATMPRWWTASCASVAWTGCGWWTPR